jgi:hypothetical protein
MADAQVYYLDGTRNQQGPVTPADVDRLIRSGTIRRDTLVWYAGMPDWRPAGEVSEFAALFARAAPPRPQASPQAPRSAAQAPRFPAAAPERMVAERMAPAAPIGDYVPDDMPTDRLVARLAVWGLFWRALLVAVGAFLVIPAPWTYTTFYRYVAGHTWLPDGRRFIFLGKPGDIWYVLIGIGLLGLLYQLANWAQLRSVEVLALLVQFMLFYIVFRWLCSKVGAEDGSVQLKFTGGFWGYVGWNVLLMISFITIIGWAWVLRYQMRWLCRNVRGTLQLEFEGTGWSILWRTLVFSLVSILLVPIPWMLRWYAAWFISQVRVADPAAEFD